MDFGPQFVRRYADEPWPDHVILEDASVAAHRVLHQLMDADAERVVFVAAFPRGDPPGTIRRYVPEDAPMDPEDVAARLGEAAGGVIDFDHTLIVARYYDALPEDTIVIEVEALDQTFGTTFSPAVEKSFAKVLQMVRDEVDRPRSEQHEH